MKMSRWFLLSIVVLLNSCVSIKYLEFDLTNYNNLKDAELFMENKSNISVISLIEIVNPNIYAVIDSVIDKTQACTNYSSKLRDVISFVVLVDSIGNNCSYSIYPTFSVKKAVKDNDILEGGFYYKDHLFLVNNPFPKNEMYKEKLFYHRTNSKDIIFLQDFSLDKSFYPVALIDEKDGSFYIKFENLCGDELIMH